MLKTIRLYCTLIGVNIRSQMQHRASFFMLLFAYFLSTFVEILSIWVLFDRFKMIEGWTLPELALIYGVIHTAFSLSEVFSRGFNTFDDYIKYGEFDRLLLRPLSTFFQVATLQVQVMRLGRFFQGLVVLIWAFLKLHLSFFSIDTVIIFLAFGGTIALFYGLFVIQATVAFWTTETLELMNITTFGGVEAGQYPLSIYPKGFRLFFTFVIPSACVTYYPIATLLKHEPFPLWAGCVLPFVGFLFLFITSQLWELGVRHYHSTGS